MQNQNSQNERMIRIIQKYRYLPFNSENPEIQKILIPTSEKMQKQNSQNGRMDRIIQECGYLPFNSENLAIEKILIETNEKNAEAEFAE